MTTTSFVLNKHKLLVTKILAVVLVGLALSVVILGLFAAANQLWYMGRIFPGVSLAGVDVSGLTIQETAQRLSQRLTYPTSGQILFRDGEKIWVASPASLGLVFDPGASAQEAFLVGRTNGLYTSVAEQIKAWQEGIDVPAVVIFDQKVAYDYLQRLAQQIDQPVIEAGLRLEGTQVISTPGQVGRVLNVDATMVYLTTRLGSFRDGEVPLVIEEQVPDIMDVSALESVANDILRTPLALALPQETDEQLDPWLIDSATLADMLLIERFEIEGAAQYQVKLDEQALASILDAIASEVEREPENARFIFNDGTGELDFLRREVVGRSLVGEATIAAIQQQLIQGEHSIALEMLYVQPEVGSDATADTLGISELVSSQQTYFRGSSSERIQNIQAAASDFHGLLVPPGSTFSMAEAMSDISLDNGYAEALIIFGGSTIKGVGGGVCQVSTTLFRTIFFGGYPIEERHAHAYRVNYYEQSENGYDRSMAGLDATVYVPLVDLKFTNDTPYWLLMEVYVNKQLKRITWKFYSTSDGRSVSWTTTGPQNVVPAPEPELRDNEELAAGEMRQVDWEAEGADVTVTRTVWRDGQVLYSDVIRTHYKAWQAVCEYGPETPDPVALAASKGLCQP